MFFTSPGDETPPGPDPDPAIVVEIHFRGSPPGMFRLRIGRRAAWELAAAFIGAEPGAELSQERS